MPTTRTATVEAQDDCSDVEYARKLTLAIKGLLLSLEPDVKALALSKVLLDLDPETRQRVSLVLGWEATSQQLWLDALRGSETAIATLREAHPELRIVTDARAALVRVASDPVTSTTG